MMKFTFGAVALVAMAGSAFGQVDGTYKPSYGGPLAVQQNPTQFGDSNLGQIDFANGSELDAAFCSTATPGKLDVLLTGNLESNFNKLVLFIDNGTGTGQNTVAGSTGLPGNYTGLKFDAGFNASQWLILNGGNSPYGLFVDGGVMGGAGGYIGGNNGQSGGALTGGSGMFSLLAAINNSNVLGVTSSSAAGALTATTGIEIQLDIASLGIVNLNQVKITAFINGSGHDYASNQWLGSLPAGFGNLGNNGSGGLSNIDLSQIPGDQFFQLPAPGAAALLGLGGLAAARRRR